MDESQIVVPPSFVRVYVPEGRTGPSEPREVILERYELCEDLAQMLMDIRPSPRMLAEQAALGPMAGGSGLRAAG